MKMFFKIILFLVFFNLAAFFVAATGFFDEEATFYGDVFKDIDPNRELDDPSNLPNATTVIDRIMLNGETTFTIPYTGVQVKWWHLMGGIVALAIAFGFLTHSIVPVALCLVSTLFVFMYTNSQSMILGITQNMHQVTQYIVLMIGVGVLIIIILTLMDYASGQASSG